MTTGSRGLHIVVPIKQIYSNKEVKLFAEKIALEASLELPEKIITPIYLKLKSKLYENLMGEYYDWYDNKKEESTSLTIQFSKLMKVRQVIAEEKINNTIELAQNIIDQDTNDARSNTSITNCTVKLASAISEMIDMLSLIATA